MTLFSSLLHFSCNLLFSSLSLLITMSLRFISYLRQFIVEIVFFSTLASASLLTTTSFLVCVLYLWVITSAILKQVDRCDKKFKPSDQTVKRWNHTIQFTITTGNTITLVDITTIPACQTLSKTLDISSATARVAPDLLKALAIVSDATVRTSAVDHKKEGHSNQIYQIHVKSKILKSLKYSPFHSLIENRKFQKFQLHSPYSSDLMAILRIFPAESEDKMWFGAFSGYP